jgi:hypothetical protein
MAKSAATARPQRTSGNEEAAAEKGIIDGNGDHQLTDPMRPDKLLRQSILVYSAGPDGDYATWNDNVTTW